MDPYLDEIPVRDNKRGPHETDGLVQKTTQQRRVVSKWAREELEDKYLRMYEENLVLKKHSRKQEDKIKRMATKLLRLVSDKKKVEQQDGGGGGGGKKGGRDIETEEMLEDLHGQIRDLKKGLNLYKEKYLVAQQQLTVQGTRKTGYGYVQSRINTGIHKAPVTPQEQRFSKSMRVQGPPLSNRGQQSLPRYGHSLLEDSRAENRRLEGVISELHEQINMRDQDIDMLQEQMKVNEAGYEEDLLKIKQQMTLGQKTAIQENIDIIRLQREVKEKSTKLTQLGAQYGNLEDKLRTVKDSHNQVLSEMETLNEQVKYEQEKVLSLQNELKSGNTTQKTIVELQERVVDLERECEILKEANEKLVSTAFDLEREKEWHQKENALKVQIAQLEATLKADVGEKGSILDRLNEERDEHEKLLEEHKDMRIKYFQMKQEHDDLQDKMRFFTKESAVDFQEIEEALVIVKSRREKESQELDFLQKVDDEHNKDNEKLVRELQAEHADTINELEKTRNMLIVQHKINKDYQMETEAVTSKMEENKAEYEQKLDEYAHLLDMRATRIRKLEAQLRDVAYGTRQYRLRPEEDEVTSDVEEMEETMQLERGQNLFEIHIKKVLLSEEAQRVMGDDEADVFCTWEFFEFEIQSTPVVKGPRPDFEFTSQYLVKVDDFFLHYLQKDSCTVELHQSFGTDYRTVAACQLKMRDIVDRSQGRLHGTVKLTGVDGNGPGANFGTLEYWVRLKVPMEQAMRLYKERTKALGYIDSNIRATEEALTAMDETAARRPADNINELVVKLVKCTDIKARREGIQPSPYCVYKFFDFGDHDTSIIPGSNNPQFNDHKKYPVSMTADLDKYLKGHGMKIYVFDDTDPEEATYLGLAKVPLIQLAHDKNIKGIFELVRSDGAPNGSIELSMKWKYAYIPPKASTKTAAQMLATGKEQPEPVPLLPGEEEELHQSVVAGSSKPRPPSGKKSRSRGPSAMSTPMVKRTQPERDMDESSVREIPPERLSPDARGDASIQEENTSIVSEGTHVTGESDAVSDEEEDAVTPRPVDEEPFVAKQEVDETASSPSEGPGPAEATSTPRIEEDLEPQEEDEEDGMEPISEAPSPDDEKTDAELLAEELGETIETKESMEIPIAEEAESEIESMASHRSGEMGGTETEEDIVRPDSKINTITPGDTVTVTVGSVSLEPEAPCLGNDAVKMLFVEYRFLGVPPEETETPYSLPKPPPNKQISFNFTKVYHVDYENHYERRQYLASMLLPDDPDQGRIRFTLVSEPDDEQGDCDDVGVAFVSVREILESGRDLIDQPIPLYDIEDEATEIGCMNVTVQCIEALNAVQQEMTASEA